MTPTATTAPSRQVLPPMSRKQAIETARRMRAGEWSIRQIRDYLAARGQDRHHETIRRWSDPELYEKSNQVAADRRARERAANDPRQGRMTLQHLTYGPEFKLARLRGLAAAGLSNAAVARVMEFDFGDPLTEHQVRYALQPGGEYPRPDRRRVSHPRSTAAGLRHANRSGR